MACNKLMCNKYKTFSVLIYSYINTSGNWENEKLCGNTTPEGRSVFIQFREKLEIAWKKLEIWEKLEIAWKHSRVFLYNSIETRKIILCIYNTFYS
jgi:hypothetical protein